MSAPHSSRSAWGLIAGLSLVAVLLGSLAGAFAEARRSEPTPLPTPAAPAIAKATRWEGEATDQGPARALVLTFAGGRADFLETYLTDGTMRNLALLASGGVVASSVAGVEPASPAVSHLSLAAGARPRRTGVVGERYRILGQPLDPPAVAATGPALETPALWGWERPDETLRTAVIFWPGGRGAAAQGANVELYLDEGLTRPSTITLETRLSTAAPAGLPPSFSPTQVATASFPTSEGMPPATLWAALTDARDDGRVAYDALYVGLSNDASAPPPTFQALAAGAWVVLGHPAQATAGVALKLAAQVRAGGDAYTLTIYQSGFSALAGVVGGLMGELMEEAGPTTPAPDLAGLRANALTLDEYLALAGLRAQWQAGVIRFVEERLAPRLTLASLDNVEIVSRAVLDGGKVNLYHAALRSAYRDADSALGRLLADLDMSETSLLVGSPHGYAGATVALNLGALLAQWLPAQPAGLVAAYSSGGSAHIAFNIQGREPAGVVSPADATRLTQELARKLTEFKLEGRPTFVAVLPAQGLRARGLDHRNSGDLYVEAAEGVLLVEGDPSRASRLSWPASEAVAGYGSGRAEMRGLFVLAGRGAADWGMIGALDLVDLAPTVGALVGLRPPAGVEGRVLSELLRE